MTAQLSRNATALPAPAHAPASDRGWPRALFAKVGASRRAILNYATVFAGSGGRLALQMAYFLALANTLSLRDMGVFASTSAAGMLIGSFSGFGFQAFLMRSGAARPSSLGGYFGAYYACFAASTPIAFAFAFALYLALFRDSISPAAYFAVIAVEVVAWRLIEMLNQVNNGLGRFAAATQVLVFASAARAAAAVLFMVAGGGSADLWALYYFLSNSLALAVLAGWRHPRVRLQWRPNLIRARLLDGFYYAFSYFAFLAQNEVDKLVVLWFAGAETAGLYAIFIRVADLSAAPLRPLILLYSRELMKARAVTARVARDIVKVEGVIAAVSTAVLIGILGLLHVWPQALGKNVGGAAGLLAMVPLAPLARNLMEFQGELFFSLDRMGLRGLYSGLMVVLKAGALALLLAFAAGDPRWGLWLNLVFALPCLLSYVGLRALLRSEIEKTRPSSVGLAEPA